MPVRSAVEQRASFSAEQPLLTGSGLLSHTTCVNSHFDCFLEVFRGLSAEAREKKTIQDFLFLCDGMGM